MVTMNRPTPNPYQPPLPTPEPSGGQSDDQPIDSLIADDAPIAFDGALGRRHLDQYLHAVGDLGWAFPFWLIFFGGIVAVSLVGIGGPRCIPLAIAVLTLLGISLTVSARPYRRSIFQSANPNWDRRVSGTIGRTGITIVRDQVETFYHWDAFVDASAGPHWVAFSLSIPRNSVLILVPEMFGRLGDWDRVALVAAAKAKQSDPLSSRPGQQSVMRIMRDANRQASIEPPPGSIRIAGPLSTRDIDGAVGRRRRPRRPIRAQVIRFAVLVSLVTIVFESVLLGLPDTRFWDLLAVAYLVAGAVWFVALHLRGRSPSGKVYHLIGFASEDAITIDFSLVTYRAPWSRCRLVNQDAQMLVLERVDSFQWLYLKRDMVASNADWETLSGFAERLAQSPASTR